MEAGSIRRELRVVNSVETDQNEMNNSPTDAMDPIVFASDRMINWLQGEFAVWTYNRRSSREGFASEGMRVSESRSIAISHIAHFLGSGRVP